VLKGKAFVALLATESGVKQFTIHRPIGTTGLGDGEWVLTRTSEIPELLQRVSSEAIKTWEAERDREIRRAVVAAGTGRRLNTATPPVEVFATSGDVVDTTRIAVQLGLDAKEKNKWVEKLTGSNAANQVAFTQALKSTTASAAWLALNPRPNHVTRGGPLADRDQVALSYLSGKSLSQAEDYFSTRRAFGLSAEDDNSQAMAVLLGHIRNGNITVTQNANAPVGARNLVAHLMRGAPQPAVTT
jgi:hypothetical protein